MNLYQSLEIQQPKPHRLTLAILSSTQGDLEEAGPLHLTDHPTQPISAFDICNSHTMTEHCPPGPILHDESMVYVYRSAISNGRRPFNFGAIGDDLTSSIGLTDRSPALKITKCHCSQHSAPGENLRTSLMHDLVEGSTPDLDRYQIWAQVDGMKPSPVVWGAPLNFKSSNATFVRHSLAYGQNQPAKKLSISADPASSTHKDSQSVVDKMGALEKLAISTPSASPELGPMAHLEQYMMDNMKDLDGKSKLVEQMSATPSTLHMDDSLSATQDSISSLEDDLAFEEPKPINAPVWIRGGPSFASAIRHLATIDQNPCHALYQPESSTQDLTSHDKFDPESFSLPYGSTVYSIKSNNIVNLHIAINSSSWSSTLGSNRVLMEAYQRKKPEEKIILLFSVAHSVKHGHKYLGMAEMVGHLNFEIDNHFTIEKQRTSHGVIPIHWIVAKDVPFTRFADLKYHEQPVTQVRHGNTIPGEVGRLVIQRYFEASHWLTATLHPLSQICYDRSISRRYTQGSDLGDSSNAVVGRHRSPNGKDSRSHRARANTSSGSRRRSASGRNHHGIASTFIRSASRVPAPNARELFATAQRSLDRIEGCREYPKSTFGAFSTSSPK